ncbi:glycosyltransferase family 4 protein [bacterium]|nr:glycosyltransferase family 4 protein [bacterium]
MDKILLIAREFYPTLGGISSYIFDIYSYFSPDRLTIITYYHPDQKSFDKTCQYDMVRTGIYSKWMQKRKWATIPLFISGFWQLVVDRKIKEIHAEQVQSGLVVFILSKIFRKPYRLFAYGMEITTSDSHGFKRKVFGGAKTIIAISKYAKELLLRQGIDARKIVIFTPGVSKNYFETASVLSQDQSRRDLGINTQKKILLTIARLEPLSRYKGIDTMINAMKLLVKTNANIHYYVVGSGPDMTWYQRLVLQSELESFVTFVGSVSEETKKKFIMSCDVFVLPNRIEYERGGETTEGFGIVFIEANIFGKPSIGGDGGARDAVEDGKSGLYANPNSAEDVASKIILLMEDTNLSKRLGEQGRKRVLGSFISENIASSFFDFIQKTI